MSFDDFAQIVIQFVVMAIVGGGFSVPYVRLLIAERDRWKEQALECHADAVWYRDKLVDLYERDRLLFPKNENGDANLTES